MSCTTYTRLLLVAAFACRDRPASPPVATLTLAIDGASRSLPVDRDMSLRSLVSVPPATWTFVRADAAARFLEIPTPTTTYPGGELRIYVDRGHVMFGVFVDGVPIASIDHVDRVEVSTRPPAPPPSLTIVVRGQPRAWTGDAREAPLRDVIGTRELQTVRVIGETEITLASIDDATLKTNQRGEFVLRVWDNGRGHPTREVRRVTKILVE